MAMFLALTTLLVQDVGALVGQLAAEDSGARDAAQGRLLEIGPAALPALREAIRRTFNVEQKRRAETLLRQISDRADIEAALRVPRVTLPRGEYTPAQVVAELSKAGREVVLPFSRDERPLTLGWDRVPLTQALDEFCLAHGKFTVTNSSSGRLLLTRGTPPPGPVTYAGPLEVRAFSMRTTPNPDDRRVCEAACVLQVTLFGTPIPSTWTVEAPKCFLKDVRPLECADLASAEDRLHPADLYFLLSRPNSFRIRGLPRDTKEIASLQGSVTLELPVGDPEPVTFEVADVGKERTVGDFTLTLVSFADGKAVLSIRGKGAAPVTRGELEQRMDLKRIVGIYEDGIERNLTALRQSSGDLKLETWAGSCKIRLRFKGRTAKATYPYELRNLPLK